MLQLNCFRGLTVLGLSLLLIAGPSFAQTSKGSIAGVIVDKTGASVPNATVTATNIQLGEKRSTTTDSVGTYRMEALDPGIYEVAVTAPGLAQLKISRVEVKASVTTTVNGTLEVGTLTTTVTVEASTGQELQTQSGDLSANINTKEIENLPFFSLNPISLVLTQPGVTQPSSREDFTNGVGFSVNGTRPRANNFLIDGQDNNDNAINGQAFQAINVEAISEVTVLTNSYGAEFGRGGGSVTNVITKGGTNDFHGSAWDIHRNSALAAIPAEDKLNGVTSNPVDIENTFGFTFGGPIKKNKLFAFGTSQWDRERQTANGRTLRLPTAAGVAALQSLGPTQANTANINFLIASLGGLVGANAPLRTVALGNDPSGNPRPTVQTGLVQRSGVSEPSNDRQWQVRSDWLATQSDTVTARYIRDDFVLTPDFFNFSGSLPPFDSLQGGPSQTFGAAWVHTFSPRVVNEFRVSYTSIEFTFGPTAATAANPLFPSPEISIAGTSFPRLGFPGALPQGRSHKSYQYQDALSYNVSSHTIKGGVDINHLSVVDAIPFNSRGTISFNAGGGFTGLGNFIDNFTGAAGAISKVFGSPITQPFVTTYAPYVQDAWRIRSNFTLNLGMRYEYWGVPENVLLFPAVNVNAGVGLVGASFPAVYSAKEQSDRNNFAPRVGIAYTPRFWTRLFGQDRTVIRAGYGIFYDGLFTNILDNTAGTSPNAVGGTIVGGSGRGSANATGLLSSVTAQLNPLATVNTVASNLVNPLTHQWNFNIQRELPGNFIVTAAYVGTRGERLFVNQEFNPKTGLNPTTGAVGPRINPALGSIVVRTNGGDSIYHAAELTVEHRFSKGILFRGAYTYSRLIDDGSEVFTTSGLSSFSQNERNQAGDRGLSAFHRAQRLALTYLWELPYVHRSQGGWKILYRLTQGWQTSGTIFFQTGAPETVTDSFDTDGDGRATNDRPNLGNPAAAITTFAFDGLFIGGTPGTLYDGPTFLNSGTLVPTTANSVHWLAQPGLGNVGRNTILTPGRQDWNLTVQRMFKIPLGRLEQQALTFRAEFFNAFNHPNLGINSVGNTISYDLQNPDFANVAFTRFGGRQIKLWVKYSF